MDAQCDKLAMVVGRQFIALIVHLCVQHDGCEAARRAGLSAAAETCYEILSICGEHHVWLTLKIWGDSFEWFRSYGSLKLLGRFSVEFLVPPSGETIHQMQIRFIMIIIIITKFV